MICCETNAIPVIFSALSYFASLTFLMLVMLSTSNESKIVFIGIMQTERSLICADTGALFLEPSKRFQLYKK